MRNSARDTHPVASLVTPVSRSTDLRRRRFLFALGAGGAGVVVTAAAALPGVSTAPIATAPPADGDSAYRESEHVRDYYRTTRI